MRRLLIMSLLVTEIVVVASPVKTNFITKIYHHEGELSDSVVCYCDQDPICNKLPYNKSNSARQDTLTYFLPMSALQSEAKNTLKKIDGIKKNGYSIVFNQVTTPIKGIKVIITYDPDKIICDYASFDAITGSKGIAFSFHKQEPLAKLKLMTEPLLQYALHSQGPNNRPKIMLDIGHGGSDEGKVGCFNVQEKNINLEVGTKVAHYLKKAGYEVLLTRNKDCFVALDERTTMANKKKVDLFLSIHANAGPHDACGIETYWFDSALLRNSLVQNYAPLKQLKIRHDFLSGLLAKSVHEATLAAARQLYVIHDRKVKTSVAQVLFGTDWIIPAALIEIGFLSHEIETKHLMNVTYQMKLAQGIAQGIIHYFKKCLS